MDVLTEYLASMRIQPLPEPPFIQLKYVNNGVVAYQNIPAGTLLGYIDGQRGYVWEHSGPYFVIDDDLVVVTHSENSLVTFIRETMDVDSPAPVNCGLTLITETHIGMITISDIRAGDELTYTAGRWYPFA
jgi:hypothetical protein